ncbi:MAG: peptide-methionine (R)-S-oxide reductase MsrB [Fimbriimonadaceae bacterium]|nr:peptide-methionine (R)-S-oxide reductase MsrB [Fimbriimonadaceae bacterium]
MKEITNVREVQKTDEEWRAELTLEQYRVLREKGTERPFIGEYTNSKEEGMYVCAGCGEDLFSSDTKFDSGCGWPSFFDTIDRAKIDYVEDTSHGMYRIEVVCKKCGGHLGHLFEDGPKPTGQRYCINSVSLKFKKPDPNP